MSMVLTNEFASVSETLALVPVLARRVEELERRLQHQTNLSLKNWLRREQVKEILDITDPTLKAAASEEEGYKYGKIRCRMEGRKPLYFREDVEAYLVSKRRMNLEHALGVVYGVLG